MTETIIYKFCPKCKTSKKAAAFGVEKLVRSGLKTYCKQCHQTRRIALKKTLIELVNIVPYDIFASHIEKTENCWLWKGRADKNGYGRFSYANNTVLTHRFSYAKHNGEFDDSLKVLHRCDNPPCLNPAHLFLGTQSANMQDMMQKKRYSKGSSRYNAKLDETKVKLIKGLLKQGEKGTAIARNFGVDQSVISDIKRGIMWRHVS